MTDARAAWIKDVLGLDVGSYGASPAPTPDAGTTVALPPGSEGAQWMTDTVGRAWRAGMESSRLAIDSVKAGLVHDGHQVEDFVSENPLTTVTAATAGIMAAPVTVPAAAIATAGVGLGLLGGFPAAGVAGFVKSMAGSMVDVASSAVEKIEQGLADQPSSPGGEPSLVGGQVQPIDLANAQDQGADDGAED